MTPPAVLRPTRAIRPVYDALNDMRIAFAIYGSLDTVSGGFSYDRALISELRELGHHIDVVSLPWVSYGRALAEALASPPAAVSRAVGCDVIVEDELIHPSLLRGAAFWQPRPRARPRPFAGRPSMAGPDGPARVTLIHNLKSVQPAERLPALKKLVERRYLRGIDAAIAVCADTLSSARALAARHIPALVAHPGRDHLYPKPPLDDRFLANRSAAAGPLRVLHVAAAVAPHKGLHRLIAALARLPDVDVQLDVVGSTEQHPDYVRAVNRQASAAGISARVHWHGEQHGRPLWDLYRLAHLFALPSDREAYALACLDALAFGLPVLATARGGLGEMITTTDTGLLLDPEDTDSWAAALTGLATDRPRLAKMARAALARHQAHHTWREVATAVQDFLAAAVARRRSASRVQTGAA